MTGEVSPTTTPGKSQVITETEAIRFARDVKEVVDFLAGGSLLAELVMKVPASDFPRLQSEYPTLFPQDIYQNPTENQVFAITFIRGRGTTPGHVKMKLYVEMVTRRVLKLLTTK